MKRLFLITLLTPFFLTLAAQDKPSFIGLQAGPSFPVGKFHMKELPEGGFALTGFNTTLEGAWFYNSWLGFGASAGTALHPVDVGDLGYEKLLNDPFIKDLRIRSDPYLTLSLYGGLYFQFPLVKKLSLTAKALGGLIYCQTPYQLYKAEYEMIGKNWFEVTSAGDFDGSFMGGAGLKYDLNDYLGVALNSEFTYNVMDFNFTQNDGSTRTDEKVVAFVNLSLGVIFRFGPASESKTF